MNMNDPETPPNIQMTPVEFSPTPSADALGTIKGFLPLHEMQFPLAIPVAIMLLTLIFSTVRDIAGFNRRLADIDKQEAPAIETLKKVPKQTDFVNGLQKSLQKLAPTDTLAEQTLEEFFPAPKQDTQAAPAPVSGTSTPAK